MILIKRCAAYIIDLVLLIFALYQYASILGTPSPKGSGYTLSNSESLMIFVIWHLYFIFFEYLFQATPGKMILRLKVFQTNNSKPGFVQILKRRSLDLLELIVISIIAPTLVLFTNKSQRLGDLFAGTIVVESSKS